MELTELVQKTEQWFVDRGLDKAEPSKQMLKLYEEYGELCEGYLNIDDNLSKDSIGDMLVVMIGLSKQLGVKSPINHHVVDRELDNYKEHYFIVLSKDLGLLSESIAKNINKSYQFDMLATVEYSLRIVSESMGFDCKECLELAYNEIKDRKGKLVNGVFIKEEDLNEG